MYLFGEDFNDQAEIQDLINRYREEKKEESETPAEAEDEKV